MKKAFLLLLALMLMFSCSALAESTPAPAATIEEAVESFLQADMAAKAKDTEDGWQRFLYEQGASNIQMNLDKFNVEAGKALPVTFTLASGALVTKSLPKYEGDPEAYLKAVVDGMKESTVKGKTSLLITAVDGGYVASYAPKAEAALAKAVKTQAAKASKSFANKTLLAVVADYLMPTPIAVPKKAPEALNSADYQPAFTAYLKRNGLDAEKDLNIPWLLYGLKGYKLDVSGGPEALKLTYTSPYVSTIITQASKTASRDILYDVKAPDYGTDEQTAFLVKRVEKDIITYRHGKTTGQSESYSFSLLSLPKNLNPEDFYTYTSEAVADTVSSALGDVQVAISLMPEYPAVPNPKNGLVIGESSGISIKFKNNEDGNNRSLSVYNSSTDQLYSVIFIEHGKTAKARLPKGKYYFIEGIGDVWYGPEYLFGDFGYYSKTQTLEIKGGYTYTYTMNVKKGKGNVESYGVDYGDVVP